VRKTDAGVCVADQKSERSRSDRFRQSLCAQVGRADVVCVVDNRGTTRLIASDREGKAERKDEPDEAEQRALQDSKRLAEMFRSVTNVPAEKEAEARRSEDDRGQDEHEL
jgi:hypothetical protein